MNFFEENEIQVIPWPPQSPDLNPIENLWAYLKGRLEEREIHGMAELEVAVRAEWNAVPLERLRTLVDSMPLRVRAVIAANGGPTRF